MSAFDDPFAGLAEVVRFGNPWHGYEQGGILYTPAGVPITLPAGQAYHRPADGGNRLIDLGLPAVTSSPSEVAKGMSWSNKAVLAGSGLGMAVPIYNPVRGSGASAVLFRSFSWCYRCPDGTVYLLWLSEGEKKIRAEPVSLPSSAGSYPANTTGGTIRLDLSAVVQDYRIIGAQTFPLYRWINFAPNGSKAAIHEAYQNGSTQYIYQIVEIEVSGGSSSTPPVVTMTANRTLESGGGLLTDYVAGDIRITADKLVVSAPNSAIYTNGSGQEVWDTSWSGVVDGTEVTTYKNGVETTGYEYVLFVDYLADGSRAEVTFKAVVIDTWVGSVTVIPFTFTTTTLTGSGTIISGPQPSTVSCRVAQHSYSSQSRQGVCVNGTFVAYVHHTDISGIWQRSERFANGYEVGSGNSTPTVIATIATGGHPTSIVTVLGGNVAVASNPRITFNDDGEPSSDPVDLFGIASAKAATYAGTPMVAAVNPLNIAVHPETGAYSPSITRYF